MASSSPPNLEIVFGLWEEPVRVDAPDGGQYEVAVVAAGLPGSPYRGGLFWALPALPFHWFARRSGKGWRVEVTDLAQQRRSIRKWRPDPYIAVVAEVRTRAAARVAADSTATLIRQGYHGNADT